jgi:tetratricopeptide (TPR) repeat protein
MDDMTKDQVEQAMADSQEMLNNDYFYLAKQKLEYVLSFDPSRKDVKVILERLEKAVQFVESSLPQESLTWEKFKLAKRLFNEGKYFESEKLFREIQQINQNNRFVTYYLDELSLQ